MLYCYRSDISVGIDINKINESNECDICHYWYFLDEGFKFQLDVCNDCHDLLIMFMNISDMNGTDCRCIINGISKKEAINLLQNVYLTEKSGVL